MNSIQLNKVSSSGDYSTIYINKFMDIEENKTLVIYSIDKKLQLIKYKELFIDVDDAGNVVSIDLYYP